MSEGVWTPGIGDDVLIYARVTRILRDEEGTQYTVALENGSELELMEYQVVRPGA